MSSEYRQEDLGGVRISPLWSKVLEQDRLEQHMAVFRDPRLLCRRQGSRSSMSRRSDGRLVNSFVGRLHVRDEASLSLSWTSLPHQKTTSRLAI